MPSGTDVAASLIEKRDGGLFKVFFNGGRRMYEYPVVFVKCRDCDGTGRERVAITPWREGTATCLGCHGAGEVLVEIEEGRE